MTPENPILLDTMDLSFSLPSEPRKEQGSEKRVVDVLHTELDLRFDIPNKAVFGKAKILAQPHQSKLDTIKLDARGFEIHQVARVVGDTLVDLDYTYDGSELGVILDATLIRGDSTEVYIDYTARPAQLTKGTGRAIRSSQGLYFINPTSDPERVHPQVWSQGETEYNSGWFPCVDQPNEKHTQEIMLTVDTSFTTLSNGKFAYTLSNGDGTKTDVWKQNLPHSTYLTMIALGEFSVVKDRWRDLDVWYYVDPEFEQYARDIFGNTPEMLEFYSSLLQYDYPWEKFHQVVVHDFVSGAMENTSAVVHGSFVQQTPREMIDGTHEDVIAHELFHHWFGDLLTAESWTQITMNEGFATYGEYLWWEHKYGKEQARLHLQADLDAYFNESERGIHHPLIRRNYASPDDVFDRHSYQKGGRVIHQLRLELGDDVFFRGLTKYLNDRAFQNVEDVHLRLAMEEVSGRDLHWFFDQWYHREGHPVAEVSYRIDTNDHSLFVKLRQTNRFGLYKYHVDVAAGNGKDQRSMRFWVDQAEEEFKLPMPSRPTWYAIDPEGDMLWEVNEDKPALAWKNQFMQKTPLLAKLKAIEAEALTGLDRNRELSGALLSLISTPSTHWSVQKAAANRLSECVDIDTNAAITTLLSAFSRTKNSALRSALLNGIDSLSRDDPSVTDIFVGAVGDSSYLVVQTALTILTERDPCSALGLADGMSEEDADEMFLWISRMHSLCGSESSLSFFISQGDDLKGIDEYLFNTDFARYVESDGRTASYSALADHLMSSDLEAMTWWSRMSTIQSLNSVKEHYESKIFGLEAAEKLSEEKIAELASLRTMQAELSSAIEAAKAMDEDVPIE